MRETLNPLDINESNINTYRQNKVRYVLQDCEDILGFSLQECAALCRILMSRGIYKWLNNRVRIIKQKDIWRKQITSLNNSLNRKTGLKLSPEQRKYLLGYMNALIQCREDVRLICHSSRWSGGGDLDDALVMRHLMEVKLSNFDEPAANPNWADIACNNGVCPSHNRIPDDEFYDDEFDDERSPCEGCPDFGVECGNCEYSGC